MKGLFTAGTMLGMAAMLGGNAFAAKTTAKPAAPKTSVKAAAKPAGHTAKAKTARHTRRAHDISAATAEKAALAKYHGKVVGRPVLQKENGRHDYAVKLMSGKTEREVKVDARTGKVENARLMTTAERGRKPAAKSRAAKSVARTKAKKTAKASAKPAAARTAKPAATRTHRS